MMDDLISRTWLLSEYDKRHKGPPGGARKLIEEAPSAQLDTYWKEQCQSYEQTINKLRESLSTQPEIIRCKDCKHRDKYGCCKHWKGLAMGDIQIATDDNDFCSQAERRTE